MAKKKILSEDGATILIALLFFAICATVGAVILAASSASSGRVSGLAEQEQSYYTVTSAARVLRDEMVGTTTINDDNGNITATPFAEPTQMEETMKNAAVSIMSGSEPTGYADEFSIFPEKDSNRIQIADVTAEFIMSPEYDITVVLYPSNDDKTYVCRIEVEALYDEESSTGTQIHWDRGKIYKGRNDTQ